MNAAASRTAATTSAGVLAVRSRDAGPEFLLVHPGGPFWARKDLAAWSMPKGLVNDGESEWAAALREFEEELGQPLASIAESDAVALAPCRMPGGKRVVCWMVEAELDVSEVRSNLFEMEWPPKSGRTARFPEVDRAAWFDGPTALVKVHRGLVPIVAEAIERLQTAPTAR